MAEIANFSQIEQDSYEDSLKYYRDLNNVVDTAREEGQEKGGQAGILRVAAQIKAAGFAVADTVSCTGLRE
ncbi:MAG: hypothetical protein WBB01_05150 [Phormidesmis sp.]